MAYRFQLNDAQNNVGIRNIAGVSVTSPDFIALVNDAQRRLMKRGDFMGLITEGIFVFQGDYVVWPKYVGTIIGARSGHRRGIQVQNQWYSFTGSWHRHHHGWHGDLVLEDKGYVPIFQPISGGGNGQQLYYHVARSEDVNKSITIYGKGMQLMADNVTYGEVDLQHKDANNNWIPGQVLTATNPDTMTPNLISKISSIIRQPTVGWSWLYEYDSASTTSRLLAVFEPNDTNPVFRASIVRNYLHCIPSQTISTPVYNSLEALVKLAFIPVVNPWDFLLIDDFDALKFMIQAIKAEEANDHSTAETLITKAIRELNFADRDQMPDQTTPVRVNAIMGGRIVNPN